MGQARLRLLPLQTRTLHVKDKTEEIICPQPTLTDPMRRRDTGHSSGIHRRKGKLREVSPHTTVPPHNYKAYQLYTLYRGKDGKIMQVCSSFSHSTTSHFTISSDEMRSTALSLGSIEWLPLWTSYQQTGEPAAGHQRGDEDRDPRCAGPDELKDGSDRQQQQAPGKGWIMNNASGRRKLAQLMLCDLSTNVLYWQ